MTHLEQTAFAFQLRVALVASKELLHSVSHLFRRGCMDDASQCRWEATPKHIVLPRSKGGGVNRQGTDSGTRGRPCWVIVNKDPDTCEPTSGHHPIATHAIAALGSAYVHSGTHSSM